MLQVGSGLAIRESDTIRSRVAWAGSARLLLGPEVCELSRADLVDADSDADVRVIDPMEYGRDTDDLDHGDDLRGDERNRDEFRDGDADRLSDSDAGPRGDRDTGVLDDGDATRR